MKDNQYTQKSITAINAAQALASEYGNQELSQAHLLDALTALRDEQVILSMRDANSSALVQEAGNERSRHVVMPLRL